MTEADIQVIEALLTNTTDRCQCCAEPAEIRQCPYFEAMDKIAPIVVEVRRLKQELRDHLEHAHSADLFSVGSLYK